MRNKSKRYHKHLVKHPKPEQVNRNHQANSIGKSSNRKVRRRHRYLIIIKNHRKLRNFQNRYYEKANLHKANFKALSFQNIRFHNSIITGCNFRDASLTGADFCNTNLKNTSFKGAKLSRCIFINCNLKNADFTGARFRDVYFIMTNTKVAEGNFDEAMIMGTYPGNIVVSTSLKQSLDLLSAKPEIYDYRVLHLRRASLICGY